MNKLNAHPDKPMTILLLPKPKTSRPDPKSTEKKSPTRSIKPSMQTPYLPKTLSGYTVNPSTLLE